MNGFPTTNRVLEIGDEGFIYHVVDDFTRGVEGAGLFARSRTGFRIIRRKEVFKDLTE